MCECDMKDEDDKDLFASCINPDAPEDRQDVCSGWGECRCGKCFCQSFGDRHIAHRHIDGIVSILSQHTMGIRPGVTPKSKIYNEQFGWILIVLDELIGYKGSLREMSLNFDKKYQIFRL